MDPPHSGAAIIRQVVPTGTDREPARRGKLGFPSKLRILPSVMAEQRAFPGSGRPLRVLWLIKGLGAGEGVGVGVGIRFSQ